MKRHNDHKLSEILNDLVETPKIKSGFYKVSIEEAWNELMGKTIASYTESLYYNKGVLVVKLNSAPLRHELSMGTEKLIALINKKVGKKVVERIVVK